MKTKKAILKYACLLGLSLVLSIGCSKDENSITDPTGTPTQEETANFNALLASLTQFSQEDESSEELIEEETPERNPQDESQECVIKKYKEAPGFDQLLSLDPTTEVIYPGAVLKGESIPTGEYIGINGGRATITLSVSLENINGKSSVDR